ncbi:MAG: hypothetical protein ACFFEL_11695 [Candidatus Thorarchaeota archaeon]
MIASERSQNVIIAVTILAALMSSVFLVGNVQYYSASYSLVGQMEVSLAEIMISDLDPTNESVFPRLHIIFNLRSDAVSEGSVRIEFIGAEVYLNDDILSYTPLYYEVPYDEQPLYPNYNHNFTLRRTTNSIDRETIVDANATGTWNWTITYRMRFTSFNQPDSATRRYIQFEYTGVTLI